MRAVLANLMKACTAITFDYRLSTFEDFDRIVVLENGRISQDSSPEMLTSKEGCYLKLMNKEPISMVLAAA